MSPENLGRRAVRGRLAMVQRRHGGPSAWRHEKAPGTGWQPGAGGAAEREWRLSNIDLDHFVGVPKLRDSCLD